MVFRLSRLPVNWKEQPQLFERYWDETLAQIEKTLNAILDIPAIQNAVTAAQAAVSTVQEQMIARRSETSLNNSYVTGYTGNLVEATSSGSIIIQGHTRVYGDTVLNPSVSVTGLTLASGASVGDVVRVYYDDPSRAGGAVTYQFTIDPATAPIQTGDRHVVGAVKIPSSGTGAGKSIRGPGYIEV